jgi:hypothetical protein
MIQHDARMVTDLRASFGLLLAAAAFLIATTIATRPSSVPRSRTTRPAPATAYATCLGTGFLGVNGYCCNTN